MIHNLRRSIPREKILLPILLSCVLSPVSHAQICREVVRDPSGRVVQTIERQKQAGGTERAVIRDGSGTPWGKINYHVVRALYRAGQRQRKPMTRLADELLRSALAETPALVTLTAITNRPPAAGSKAIPTALTQDYLPAAAGTSPSTTPISITAATAFPSTTAFSTSSGASPTSPRPPSSAKAGRRLRKMDRSSTYSRTGKLIEMI